MSVELTNAIAEEDYVTGAGLLQEFNPYLRQHIIDEEARVLKLLLEAYGRQGAEEAIKVFQQHKRIHNAIEEMRSLASTSPSLLVGKRAALDCLLDCFGKEEPNFPLDTEDVQGKGEKKIRDRFVEESINT